ncbi:MAG TPA: GNAT family N-acetyltransferase [Sphingomonas sp.]|nr:GNAT family N-acetyltransferase [Sphingomonas sp.]
MFETERLSIRRIGLKDAGFMLAMLTDRGFLAHIGDRGVRTLEDAEDYIRDRVLSSYEEHGFGMYCVALKDGGEPIGTVGFVRREGLSAPDIGFAFLEPHTGRGYGQEAARALIDWGRETLNIGPLLAITAPQNVASAALLRTLGFRETGRVVLPAHGGESRLFVEG